MNTCRPNAHAMLLPSSPLFADAALLLSILACARAAETSAAPRTEESTRMDRSHRYLSGRVLSFAESLNNAISSTFRQEEDHESEMTRRFYGNLLTAYQVEGSHIRMTPRLTLTEGRGNQYKLHFSARLRLPDLSDRLRLYADSYDTDYDTMDEIFSTRYRRQLEEERIEAPNAGLTYFFSDGMSRKLSLSGGLRFRPEPSPKIRLRGRLRKTLDNWRADVSESVFWNERDGFGEKTEFTLDRQVGESHLFRLASSLVWSEISDGVDWGQSASCHALLNSQHSAALKLGVRGHTHPSWTTDQYLVRVPFRRRLYRDWVTMVIEPGLDFFREDDFRRTLLVNFRVEIVFGSFSRR